MVKIIHYMFWRNCKQ